MPEKNLNIDFNELAAKYLSGNASDAEVRELETWVLAAPENKEQFKAFKKAWILTGINQPESAVSTDQLWKQTSAKLFSTSKVVEMKPRSTRRRWMGIAATVALLIAASTLFIFKPWADQVFTAQATDAIQPVDLNDGSAILLNQTSALTYQYDQKESVRKVQLTGDAFFDVARDESAPFIIQAEMLEIEVLGTSFYVDAREGLPEIQVIVESGSVAVRYNDQETILQADEMAVFQKSTSQLNKQANEDDNYLALKTNTLIFENTRMDEVIFDINRYFHSSITIDNERLKACTLSSTFQNKSLPAILTILESSFGLEVLREGDAVVLSGNCE